MNIKTHIWAKDSIFYHIYPLGLCEAPFTNDFTAVPAPRLEQIEQWIDHISLLGCNALYLGPVFESGTHGYDTANYFEVDRRLGTHDTLRTLIKKLHKKGIRTILDGVFNHVGRDFWAFRNLQENGINSPYYHWFSGIAFNRQSPYGDAFAYEGWNGHYNLVKLNVKHPEVQEHLFSAVKMWMEEFDIDGLRLDAADVIDKSFLQELALFCRRLKPEFWLLGEVIHGDYTQWANTNSLDSVTNYECYKGLYSSHNDRNYFEIAYSLNRQSGTGGIYKELTLYNFADNHDVNRLASTLQNPAHLYPLHVLLFTIPGIPSIYYGSEWGISGLKQDGDDSPLRPALCAPDQFATIPHPDLPDVIRKLSRIRQEQSALQYGTYEQLFVSHEQFAFIRQYGNEKSIVIVNASSSPVSVLIPVHLPDGTVLVDSLNDQMPFTISNGSLQAEIPSCWSRILTLFQSKENQLL